MSVPGAWYLVLAAVLFGIGATGLLVRRNVLVMFMCVELMLNAVNLTFVTFARLLDDIGGQVVGVLRPGGRGRRGGGRAGDHRGHVPPAGRGDRRRHPLPEGLTQPVNAAYVIVALPLAGALILLFGGRRTGDPLSGWLATVMAGGSFVATVVVWAALLGPVAPATGPSTRTSSPGSRSTACTSTSACSSTRFRSLGACSSPGSAA